MTDWRVIFFIRSVLIPKNTPPHKFASPFLSILIKKLRIFAPTKKQRR